MKRHVTLQDLAKLYQGTSAIFEIVYPDTYGNKTLRVIPSSCVSDDIPNTSFIDILGENFETYFSLTRRIVQQVVPVANGVVRVILENNWDIPSIYPTLASLTNFICVCTDGIVAKLNSCKFQFEFDKYRTIYWYSIIDLIQQNSEFVKWLLNANAVSMYPLDSTTYMVKLEHLVDRYSEFADFIKLYDGAD